eukprot:1593029-Pyramimonas_sp.AAC.1
MRDILDGNIQDIFVDDESLFGLGDVQEMEATDKTQLEERKRLLAEGLKSVTENLFSSVKEKAESL